MVRPYADILKTVTVAQTIETFGSSFKICSIRCQIKGVSESAKKITVNGPKDHLDDRICTDLG